MDRPYNAIFFDVGYTLVWFHPSAEALTLQALHDAGVEVSLEQLRAILEQAWGEYYTDAATARFPATKEYDRRAWYERQRQLLRRLGCNDEETLRRFTEREMELFGSPDAIRLYDDVITTLDELKTRGYRLGVISNWSWNLRDRLRQVSLHDYFEVIIASAYAGCNKPHPAIFQQALQQMEAPAERSVHVGDVYEADVVGAQKVGMTAVLLDRSRQHEDPDCLVIHDLKALLRCLDGA